MSNPFQNRTASLSGPAHDILPVVPDDTADLQSVGIGLYVEVGGTIAIVTIAGGERNVTVPDAFYLPVGIRAVRASGTTASGIHALVLS